MAIEFVLLVNKQGQTRLAQYTKFKTINERTALEGEIVRKCLSRNEDQVCIYNIGEFYNFELMHV